VLASPPSRLYEARKFVRRHRVGVGALAAVFMALAIGLVFTLRERAKAESARDQLAVRAKELEIETARKDRVLAFQNRLLTAASHDAQGYDVRVVELLDIAREELRTTHEEPEVALELHRALGEAYANLGRLEDALEESRATLELARSSTGISIERLAGFERIVVHLRCKLGADPAAAADEARSLLERNLARLGPSAPETLRSARVLTEQQRPRADRTSRPCGLVRRGRVGRAGRARPVRLEGQRRGGCPDPIVDGELHAGWPIRRGGRAAA